MQWFLKRRFSTTCWGWITMILVVFVLLQVVNFPALREVAGEPEKNQLEPQIAPVLLEFDSCMGFAEQQIQVVKALMLGSKLGAQVILTFNNEHVWDLWTLEVFLDFADSLFHRVACEGLPGQRKFWCVTKAKRAVLVDKNKEEIPVTERFASRKAFQLEDSEQIAQIASSLWSSESSPSIVRVTCSALSRYRIVEPSDDWSLFWKIWDSINFSAELHRSKEELAAALKLRYAKDAAEQAQQMGFLVDQGVFNVLHLSPQLCSGQVHAGLKG